MPYTLAFFDDNGICMTSVYRDRATVLTMPCSTYFSSGVWDTLDIIGPANQTLLSYWPEYKTGAMPTVSGTAYSTYIPTETEYDSYSATYAEPSSSTDTDDDYPWASSSTQATVILSPPSSSGASQNNGGPGPSMTSSLPIILSVVFGTLFFLTLAALLILWLRRRRAQRNAHLTPFRPHGGNGILSDRRISTASSHRSRGSTSSFMAEPTFIQPVLGSVGLLGSGVGARTLTSREKRLTMRRAGGQGGAGGDAPGDTEPILGMGGEDDYGDEVLRRKMDGWAALARSRDPTRAQEDVEKDPFADGNPFTDDNSINTSLLPHSALPSLPPPLRLPLSITTSVTPPRASPPIQRGPTPSSTLSPQFDPSYSPATPAAASDEGGQAEDGGVSLMRGGPHPSERQAPPAYQW